MRGREREKEFFLFFYPVFFPYTRPSLSLLGKGGGKWVVRASPPPSTTILRLSINTQKPVGQAWFVWCHFLPFLLVTVKADEKIGLSAFFVLHTYNTTMMSSFSSKGRNIHPYIIKKSSQKNYQSSLAFWERVKKIKNKNAKCRYVKWRFIFPSTVYRYAYTYSLCSLQRRRGRKRGRHGLD